MGRIKVSKYLKKLKKEGKKRKIGKIEFSLKDNGKIAKTNRGHRCLLITLVDEDDKYCEVIEVIDHRNIVSMNDLFSMDEIVKNHQNLLNVLKIISFIK